MAFGLAEWQVFTPGGHVIRGVNNLKEPHGVCLMDALAEPRPEGSLILINHLLRWRYYPGHVAAETEEGYLLLEERGHKIRRFHSEVELLSTTQLIGPALSPWLTPADAQEEAMFPASIWEPCTREMHLQASGSSSPPDFPSGLAPDPRLCALSLAPERLRYHRLTTWGRVCEYWSSGNSTQIQLPFSPPAQLMPFFCATIFNAE